MNCGTYSIRLSSRHILTLLPLIQHRPNQVLIRKGEGIIIRGIMIIAISNHKVRATRMTSSLQAVTNES